MYQCLDLIIDEVNWSRSLEEHTENQKALEYREKVRAKLFEMKDVIKEQTKIQTDIKGKNLKKSMKSQTSKTKQIKSCLRILQKRIDVEKLDTFSVKFHIPMKVYNWYKQEIYEIWITPLFMLVTQILVILYALQAKTLSGFCWVSILCSWLFGIV